MDKRTRELGDRLRRCDPGHYLTKDEVKEVLTCIQDLEEAERSDSHGHLGFFYMKVKANADHHDCKFKIPGRWAQLYEGYKADLEIYKLSKPLQLLAILFRNLGIRRSFLQGEGSGIRFRR